MFFRYKINGELNEVDSNVTQTRDGIQESVEPEVGEIPRFLVGVNEFFPIPGTRAHRDLPRMYIDTDTEREREKK